MDADHFYFFLEFEDFGRKIAFCQAKLLIVSKIDLFVILSRVVLNFVDFYKKLKKYLSTRRYIDFFKEKNTKQNIK